MIIIKTLQLGQHILLELGVSFNGNGFKIFSCVNKKHTSPTLLKQRIEKLVFSAKKGAKNKGDNCSQEGRVNLCSHYFCNAVFGDVK